MATSLRLVFKDNHGRNFNVVYPFASSGASENQVKTLMQRMITNKDVFVKEPEAIVGAEFVVNEVMPIDVT